MSDVPPEPSGPASRPEGAPAPDPWAAFSLLVSGVAVWGGAGWLLAEWLDNQIFVMFGLLLGMGASLYLVWYRYGKA